MRAEYINPFLVSTNAVFSQMLDIQVKRSAPFRREGFAPQFDVTGIIGLTGKITGTVALSVSKTMALNIASRLIGEPVRDLNAQVVDAVGEITNMIAGAAKGQLEQYELHLGLPSVVTGRSTVICFPSDAIPISIPFDSELGPFVVEVGFKGTSLPHEGTVSQAASCCRA